jgi:hypothetical protein
LATFVSVYGSIVQAANGAAPIISIALRAKVANYCAIWNFPNTITTNAFRMSGVFVDETFPILPMIFIIVSDITRDIIDAAVDFGSKMVNNAIIDDATISGEATTQNGGKMPTHSITETVSDIAAEISELFNKIFD